MSEIQARYINDETKYLVIEGSAGSGKTIFASIKVIFYALQYKGAKIGVFRQTLPALKVTTWAEIRNLLDDYNIKYSENKSDGYITFPNKSQIIFKPLDDMRKIRSMNLDMVLVDQAEETTKEVFHELESRVRSKVSQKYYGQLIFVVTPEGKNHWIYQRFHMHSHEPDVKILYFHYTSNPFVDENYIKLAEDRKKYDYDNYLRLTLGRWADVGGLIYNHWDIKVSDKGYNRFIMGLDFGYTNPSAMVLMGEYDGEYYVIDELKESHLTNNQFIMKILKLLKNRGLSPANINSVHGDSAEPDRIEEFAEYGFNIYPAQKSILAGLNTVRSTKLHIADNCTNTIEEIKGYSYKKDKNGNSLEEPLTVNDHLMDALRYALVGERGFISPQRYMNRDLKIYTY